MKYKMRKKQITINLLKLMFKKLELDVEKEEREKCHEYEIAFQENIIE